MKKNLQHMNSEKELQARILDAAARMKVPAGMSKQEALQKLEEKIANGIRPNEPVRKINMRNIVAITAAAATLTLIFLWYFMVRQPSVEVFADKGLQKSYTLPDGSEIELNADSKVEYNKRTFLKDRNVKFSGEAFFKIQKGKKFIIATEKADIQILGTSFNVYARDNNFDVSCVTGKIRVSSGKNNLIITAGEKVFIKDGMLQRESLKDVQKVASWRQGEFNFENASLLQVFQEIERQYNVNFELPEIEDKFFTGGFSNKNLVDALDIVCIPMGLTYEIGSNSNIIIQEKR